MNRSTNLGLLAACLLTIANHALGAADCRKVNITKSFVGIPEVCETTSCETWRSNAVLGPGLWNLESTVVDGATLAYLFSAPLVDLAILLTGNVDTFVARDGDELYATNVVAGSVDFESGPGALFAGIMYVRGGTGRFANAYGDLFIRVDNANGTAQVDGELCGVTGRGPLD